MLVPSHRIRRAEEFDSTVQVQKRVTASTSTAGSGNTFTMGNMARGPDISSRVISLQEGFQIGYNYQAHKCKGSEDNMRSAKDHPQVVDSYIRKECEAGRLLGPFDPDLFLAVQISRFGVIPKSEPDSWRLILDLSYPEGRSVNDGISPEICSLSYMTVDDAARAIVSMGQGAMWTLRAPTELSRFTQTTAPCWA